MAGDITRSTFDPKKGYTSVRMQQGRLQLDADWNEQADIQNHLRRAYVTDMIGSGSGASKVDPITGKPSSTNFQLCRIGTGTSPETSQFTDLALLPGHFYINGVLCESAPGTPFKVTLTSAGTLQVVDSLTIDGQRLQEGDWLILDGTEPSSDQGAEPHLNGWRVQKIDVKTRILTVDDPVFPEGDSFILRRVMTYTTQLDFPEAPPLEVGTYLAYLDVWERQLGAIDDPTLREVALNVPDTTTRTKTVWQVKLKPSQSSEPLNDWQSFLDLSQNRDRAPLLNACARLCGGNSTNGITANRLGNFLYRVEIHQGNSEKSNPSEQTTTASFKWSRTNGSVVSPIKKIEGDVIRIAKASQDVWADSQPGQWLELLTLAQELKGEPGILVPLVRVSDTKIEFDPARIIGGAIPDNVTKVRRWDHTVDKAPQGAIPIQSEWIELESGIKVQFYSDRTYRTGDYWLIPARTATNDIEWPSDRADEDVTIVGNLGASVSQPLPQPPNGIEHQYALLSVVTIAGDNPQTPRITDVSDQRVLFPPLQRALDTSGGTITGSLTINQNLEVKETTTTKDLKVTGQFAADTFRGKTVVIANLPLDDTAPNYGTLTAENTGGTPYLAFRTEASNHFAFLNGNVNIGSADPPSHTLSVNGTINGLNVLKDDQPLALEIDLNTHVNNQNNPHRVTANQIDTQGGANQIVTQINNGSGTINADRVSNLTSHINDFNNPHRVTANQIDTQDGANQIVTRINEGTGVINAARIDPDLIRQATFDNHANNLVNPHQVTVQQIDGPSGTHGIVSQINAGTGIIEAKNLDLSLVRSTVLDDHINVSNPHQITAAKINALPVAGGNITGNLGVGTTAIPPSASAARLYVSGNLYIDDEPSGGGGAIFAKKVRINNDIVAGTFTQISSAALKSDITDLSRQEIAEVLGQLRPVKFRYNHDENQNIFAGFIAEEVPELVATTDRQGVKIMDVVAILTKAVQDNRKVINQLSNQVTQQAKEINQLKQALAKDSSQV